jgi:uncharacterized membrane protein
VPGSANGDSPQNDRRLRSHYRHPMVALKAAHSAERTMMERFADTLIRVASSTPFLALHVLWFAVWIPWNMGLLPVEPFDPFPFGLLTMIVSLEAIFLAIFVLIGQNKEAAIAELREELTLQVNLRMEAEVTKTLQLVAGLYTRLGYQVADDEELREMLQTLDTQSIERELTAQIKRATGKRPI